MPTTPRSLLERSLTLSSKNDPRKFDWQIEGLRLATRCLRKFFTVAARVAPAHYGATAALPVVPQAGWTLPASAEALYRIETAAGVEVVVVPEEDRRADTARPALLYRGRTFRPAGNPLDPALGAALTAFFAKRPDSPANLDAAVDALWESDHDELVSLEIAASLALKDGRLEELAALRIDRDVELRLFVAHLEHVIGNESRRRAPLRTFTAKPLVPIDQLLAGGSSVSL